MNFFVGTCNEIFISMISLFNCIWQLNVDHDSNVMVIMFKLTSPSYLLHKDKT